ncbi:DUF2231 domain-containing protein [Nocardioides sp. P86]|uniref:DUF2231 domain-containing protein n=1 Tax=Nocardioides sp. P86 TaxID=2939569 RepID=UPI0020409A22|nr:DUF2231 domain-containing protein [Nocardioides sp. P86]MCM3515155.1 hypothetical protein [Nocardioides sp. P86]
MFDLINGLPIHPLVVHAVVVLLPLAILGTIAIAARPVWRLTYGPLVVAIAAVAAALVPVATSSGEALEERVGDPGQHAALGDQLLWFALPVLVLALVLVVLARRERSRTRAAEGTGSTSSRTPARATSAVAVLAVLASLACAVQVYRVGDSGAKAVWSDQVSAAPSSTGD